MLGTLNSLHGLLTQADAIVLEGGYVLFLVFRGDNTAPIYYTNRELHEPEYRIAIMTRISTLTESSHWIHETESQIRVQVHKGLTPRHSHDYIALSVMGFVHRAPRERGRGCLQSPYCLSLIL